MYANTNQALQTRRLSGVFPADRKVHLTPAGACINLVSKITCLHVPVAAKSLTSKAD